MIPDKVGVDEDMLSLDEEKIPCGVFGSGRDPEQSGVTSSSPSPVQTSGNLLDESDPLPKTAGWGMWLVHEVRPMFYDPNGKSVSLSYISGFRSLGGSTIFTWARVEHKNHH